MVLGHRADGAATVFRRLCDPPRDLGVIRCTLVRAAFALAVRGRLPVLRLASVPVAAASSVVECGQLTGYAAPDPVGPTNGSVQLGLTDTWTILADATLSPEARGCAADHREQRSDLPRDGPR